MIDTYKTLKSPSTSLFKSKGSKFFGYAFEVSSEDEVKEKLDLVRVEHPKARHVCYAYKLGLDAHNFRANDDGEPSGSAGKPILGQINSFELSNVLVAVVRYFGGTLLGVPGLIHAYKTTTSLAFEEGTLVEKKVRNYYTLTFGYEHLSKVMSFLKKEDIEICEQKMEEKASLKIAMELGQTDDLIRSLKATVLEEYLENIDDETVVDGLALEFVSKQ